MQIDNSESQIPDMQIGKTVSLEDDRLTAKLQIEEDQILQRKREAKINNKVKQSLTNYQAIQNILRAEIDLETDNDVRAAILQQLELLEAILELKYLGKKDKLNTKLQKQAQDLVPAQTQSQNQNQNQVQEQNKPKTHLEILQIGLQEKS